MLLGGPSLDAQCGRDLCGHTPPRNSVVVHFDRGPEGLTLPRREVRERRVEGEQGLIGGHGPDLALALDRHGELRSHVAVERGEVGGVERQYPTPLPTLGVSERRDQQAVVVGEPGLDGVVLALFQALGGDEQALVVLLDSLADPHYLLDVRYDRLAARTADVQEVAVIVAPEFDRRVGACGRRGVRAGVCDSEERLVHLAEILLRGI